MNNNKEYLKGLLVYEPDNLGLINIGDYVQSIAARQFIGNPDLYISREHLNEYTGQPLKLIANGWYMNLPQNWPPSQDIKPLFVALHINKLVENRFLKEDSLNYLKKHEPIGCRDYHTMHLLQSKGIDAYFSGCMTLTLGQSYQRSKFTPGKVFFTDVCNQSFPTLGFKLKCILNLLTKFNKIRKIKKRQEECGICNRLRSVAAFYTSYSQLFEDEVLEEAIYKTQQVKANGQTSASLFKDADELLIDYCSAQYVVTSRIHCALPCLAMGVPVLFVYDENAPIEHNCRLDGLIQLFHLILINGDKLASSIAAKKKISLETIFSNKPDFMQFSSGLIERCTDFIKRE